MTALGEWWEDLRGLARLSWRILRRRWAQIVAIWGAGWLVYQVCLVATLPLQSRIPWIAVAVFSLGLVAKLAGIILAIRVAGSVLWDLLPDGMARLGRDTPLTKVLSVALLPFVGVYAVFDGVSDAVYEMFVYGTWTGGDFGASTAIAKLDPVTTEQRLVVLAVIGSSYVIRRILETAAEKLDNTALGIAGALMEGFFSVTLVFSVANLLSDVHDYYSGFVVSEWVDGVLGRAATVLAALSATIPGAVAAAWGWLNEVALPFLGEAALEPLLWLAVAGLVFGSYTLSLAELWDYGEQAHPRAPHVGHASKAVALEGIEMFYDDAEDRIIPVLQSIRHALRPGLSFVASYLVLYSVAAVLPSVLERVLLTAIGAQRFEVWMALNPVMGFVIGVLAEPLRIALLAAAMVASLGERNRPKGWSVSAGRLGISLVCLAVAGSLGTWTQLPSDTAVKRVAVGEYGEVVPGATLRVTGTEFGDRYSTGMASVTTEGVFVGVNVEVVSYRQTDFYQCALESAHYSSTPVYVESGGRVPNPGFRLHTVLVYEVMPDDLEGATLVCGPATFFRAYDDELRVSLGIGPQNAGRGTVSITESIEVNR